MVPSPLRMRRKVHCFTLPTSPLHPPYQQAACANCPPHHQLHPLCSSKSCRTHWLVRPTCRPLGPLEWDIAPLSGWWVHMLWRCLISSIAACAWGTTLSAGGQQRWSCSGSLTRRIHSPLAPTVLSLLRRPLGNSLRR